VNASAFTHYCIRQGKRAWTDWLPPAAGFLVCLYIWLNLSHPAKITGGIWLGAGLLYGLMRGSLKRRPKSAIS